MIRKIAKMRSKIRNHDPRPEIPTFDDARQWVTGGWSGIKIRVLWRHETVIRSSVTDSRLPVVGHRRWARVGFTHHRVVHNPLSYTTGCSAFGWLNHFIFVSSNGFNNIVCFLNNFFGLFKKFINKGEKSEPVISRQIKNGPCHNFDLFLRFPKIFLRSIKSEK